ncbi:MAG: Peptide deformylase [Myxococcales bacterium]|nr:Peptide deformylase [Myxococcales bacterium]
MPTLKIVQTGDPVLRQQARALTAQEIALPGIQMLIALMRDTMRDAPGVGLAAPQIGESLQLVVIEDPVEDPERDRAKVPFHVLVNPTLTLEGDERVEAFEGCLSFAGFSMVVPRARNVTVTALDERGEPVEIKASGWYARILQHEIDHLRGVLCCDRMDARTLTTAENHARHWRTASVSDVKAAVALPQPDE